MRATVCLRKSAGGWKIVHEHESVPFYMDESLRPAFDLEPCQTRRDSCPSASNQGGQKWQRTTAGKWCCKTRTIPPPPSRSTLAMYEAMKQAFLKVLPKTAPGLTADELREAVLPHLPEDLYPEGAKAGWYTKAVQLDLEAKGIIAREKTTPLRLHKV